LDVAGEKDVWFVGKDMDIVGEYGWSDTDTVAVSFDTRWEVIYDQMIQEYMAGNMAPETVVYPGMETTMTLADGTVETTVDLMNDGKVGVDAISPAALPLIPQEIIDLVQQRREQMMNGEWDPFTEHEFVSNGTGLELPGLPVPAAGTVVKAGVVPTVEFRCRSSTSISRVRLSWSSRRWSCDAWPDRVSSVQGGTGESLIVP
jgi:simple sugar transport system substrate-binding protein